MCQWYVVTLLSLSVSIHNTIFYTDSLAHVAPDIFQLQQNLTCYIFDSLLKEQLRVVPTSAPVSLFRTARQSKIRKLGTLLVAVSQCRGSVPRPIASQRLATVDKYVLPFQRVATLQTRPVRPVSLWPSRSTQPTETASFVGLVHLKDATSELRHSCSKNQEVSGFYRVV